MSTNKMDALPIELQELIIEYIFPTRYNDIHHLTLIIISTHFHMYILLLIKQYLAKFALHSDKNMELLYFYKSMLHPVLYKKLNPTWNIRNPFIYTALNIFLNSSNNKGLIISKSYLELYILRSIFSQFYPGFNVIENFNGPWTNNFIMLKHKNEVNSLIYNYVGKFDIIIPLFDWYEDINFKILLDLQHSASCIIYINDMLENISI